MIYPKGVIDAKEIKVEYTAFLENQKKGIIPKDFHFRQNYKNPIHLWHGKECEILGCYTPQKTDKWEPYAAIRFPHHNAWDYEIIASKYVTAL